MEAALEIAHAENKQVTSLFREALEEYVQKRKPGAGSLKLERYLGTELLITSSLEKVLTREELRTWSDQELVSIAKKVRARVQEIGPELKRRGYLQFRF